MVLIAAQEAAKGIGDAGLATGQGWRRIVIEKPFGHDLASARELSEKLHQVFRESEVYLRAAETGIGIFEMDPAEATVELEEFAPIVDWVDPRHEPAGANVIELQRARRFDRPVAITGSSTLGGAP